MLSFEVAIESAKHQKGAKWLALYGITDVVTN